MENEYENMEINAEEVEGKKCGIFEKIVPHCKKAIAIALGITAAATVIVVAGNAILKNKSTAPEATPEFDSADNNLNEV